MADLVSLPASPEMLELCAQQKDRRLMGQIGTMRSYKAGELDHQIFRQFKTDHGRKIAGEGDFVQVRQYGPVELHRGTMSAYTHATMIFIPIAPIVSTAANTQPEVLYQPDKADESIQEPLSWHIGTHIRIPGGSRIVVKEGAIWFDMIEFLKEVVDGEEGEEANKAFITKLAEDGEGEQEEELSARWCGKRWLMGTTGAVASFSEHSFL